MSKYKQEILSFLLNHQSEYISGQMLADQLGVSRTAIWKAIEALKCQGYEIESIKNKGYKISRLPKLWDEDYIDYLLKNTIFAQQFVYQEVTSTQTVAEELLLEHNDAFMVLSEIQTQGRGRFKRPWASKPNTGLWMSLVLHPNISYQQIATFNLFMSIALAETIKKECNVPAKIKWPNDIYINDKKVCGFLTEIKGDPDGVHTIICGIGLNINHAQDDFDVTLQDIATSLKIASGKEINRYEFLKALIINIERYYHAFLTQPFSEIKATYKSYSMIWDRTLRYTEGNKQIYGKAIDLKDDGELVVLDEAGNLHRFISADIEL